jgi:2-methylcitrate dehydratase PrpD
LLTRGLGEAWRIHRSSIKPYASCRGTHAAVEAMLRFRNEGVRAKDLASIRVNVHPTLVRMCGSTHAATLLDAQMSLPYALAVALVLGAADLPMFAESLRRDPIVLGEASRIRVLESPEPMTNVAAELVLGLKDGGERKLRIDVPAGSATNPLSDVALVAKYRSLATPVLGGRAALDLEGKVLALGSGSRPHALLDLLATAPQANVALANGDPA